MAKTFHSPQIAFRLKPGSALERYLSDKPRKTDALHELAAKMEALKEIKG